jgi:hypothetical protein
MAALTESARATIESRDWYRSAAADGAVPHHLPRYSGHSAALGSVSWCLYLQPRPGCEWLPGGGASAAALLGADGAALQLSAVSDGSAEADAACMLALCDLRLRGPIAAHPRSRLLADGWPRSLCEREPLRAAAARLRGGDDRALLPALGSALPAGSDLAQARVFVRGRRRLAGMAQLGVPPPPPLAAADVWL